MINFIQKQKINENNEDQDFFSAIKVCKKKRIGPSRTEDNRPDLYSIKKILVYWQDLDLILKFPEE